MVVWCRFYGFKNLQYGITSLENLTATELKNIASIIYLILFHEVCTYDSTYTLAKVVEYMYRFHAFTVMTLEKEHTDKSLVKLALSADELLENLLKCDLIEVRPSHYLFVKAHLFYFHLHRCVKNNGALSNTCSSLMESHHIMTKADGSLTGVHNRTLYIMTVQQRR